MARVNRNIHSTPITPTVSIPIHLPPVAGSQFAMCLKECSVRCTDSPAGWAAQVPSGTEVADDLTMTCRCRKLHLYVQCNLKETSFFSVFTELFGFFPWTGFEQRPWQSGRECSSEIFLEEGSDTERVKVKWNGGGQVGLSELNCCLLHGYFSLLLLLECPKKISVMRTYLFWMPMRINIQNQYFFFFRGRQIRTKCWDLLLGKGSIFGEIYLFLKGIAS